MMDYQGKKVRVFGLGESGLAMALWLARCGAEVSVADTRAAPPRLEALRAAAPQVAFCAGPFEAHLAEGMDALAVSPGLAPAGELAAVCAAAGERGIPLWSEIELFAQALAGLREQRDYAPRVLAVTGTNGKTTVTSLTGLLCERAGLTVRVAGNISPAALDVLRQALDEDALPQVWVLELSSFQLHFTHSLRADAAVVLNLSQDHLDWHGDMAAYAAAKARIFGPQTIRIGNRDDRQTMQMLAGGASAQSFGTDAPDAAPDFGLVTEHGMTWLVQAQARDGGAESAGKRRRQPALELEAPMIQRLMPADALQIRGRHNAANALAALALCNAIGLPLAALLHALREYRGEPHRVELIATIGGVEYYDDSKGTNVGATVAALNGLGAGGAARLHLIAGGDGKGQDFAPLAQPVARHARAVYLIGRDAPALRAALAQTGVPLNDCASLEQALEQAAAQAQPGEAVLLSPACASFDMFRDYAHRAQVFIDAVRAHALERGEVLP